MSAESASSSAAVGSSSSSASSLVGALGRQLGARFPFLADDLDRVVVVVGGERDVGFFVDVLLLVLVGLLEGGAGRAEAGELGLFEVGLGPTGSGQDGFDELLIKWDRMAGYLRLRLRVGIRCGWWSCAHPGGAREEAGLVAPAMERLALLVHAPGSRAGAGRSSSRSADCSASASAEEM